MKFPLRGSNSARLSLADFKRIAEMNNLPVANLRAVVKIEAAGAGYNRAGLMKLLYEYHIAFRRTKGKVRYRLAKAGLAVKRWGAKKYPRAMAARHEQVKNAVAIAGDAGFEFASYGLPQMMGFNHKVCGFVSARAMVSFMLEGEANQLEVMIRFLKGTGLINHLRKGNWKSFARGYNGPAYAKHGYDRKLAHAAKMFARNPGKDAIRKPVPKSSAAPDLDVRQAQKWLAQLGFKPGAADGWMGDITAEVILQFQRSHPDLSNDGLIGPHTLAALEKAVEMKAKPAPSVAGSAAVVVGGGAVAVAGSFIGSIPIYAWIGLAVVAVIIPALLLRKYLAHRDEYTTEIIHQKNIKSGKIIAVEPWAERGHPDDAIPLTMKEVRI